MNKNNTVICENYKTCKINFCGHMKPHKFEENTPMTNKCQNAYCSVMKDICQCIDVRKLKLEKIFQNEA